MMTQNADKKREQIQMFCMDDLVPQDHLLRLIDQAIDWSFIYDLVIDKYSADNGRPSMDPVMLIKIPFIQYLYGIRSMRQTVKEIEVNVAYRWFLGLEMMDKVPHFSTFGFWSADQKRFVYSLRLSPKRQPSIFAFVCKVRLQLRTSSNQSLTSIISFVFSEVLDESLSQILCLLFPLGRISVGISGIQNSGINTG